MKYVIVVLLTFLLIFYSGQSQYDLNTDGKVNLLDQKILKNEIFLLTIKKHDLNKDGKVNGIDYLILHKAVLENTITSE